MTAPDLVFKPGLLDISHTLWVDLGEILVDLKAVCMMVVVIKQSLGSWSHMWSHSKVSGCGSTSLFGSRAGTHQGK